MMATEIQYTDQRAKQDIHTVQQNRLLVIQWLRMRMRMRGRGRGRGFRLE